MSWIDKAQYIAMWIIALGLNLIGFHSYAAELNRRIDQAVERANRQ